MAEPIATATDILTLTQWFSPSYPIGAYAYSHGLEQAIDSGQVHDAATAQEWIADVLKFGAGRSDAIAVHLSFALSDLADIYLLDRKMRALTPSAERLKEADLQGKAFADITRRIAGFDLLDLTYPVAAGQAARMAGLPSTLTVQFYLHAFVSNLAAAAIRRVPLGQSDGQMIIRDLTPDCIEIARLTVSADFEDIATSAFLSDIASMQHETQYSRIFRT